MIIEKSKGKEYLIARYGEQWYEDFKARCRNSYRERYHTDPEAARKRRREQYARNPKPDNDYGRAHREIYRINSRDRARLVLMGVDLEGKEVHHIKYHKDNADTSWYDDLEIMTRSEHRTWHREHPEFRAADNVV